MSKRWHFLALIMGTSIKIPSLPISLPRCCCPVQHWPGINTYFDSSSPLYPSPLAVCLRVESVLQPGVLQPIPYSTTNTSTSTTTQLDTFLYQQKSAHLSVGVYFREQSPRGHMPMPRMQYAPNSTPFPRRLYRLGMEGVLKVPSTPLIVGVCVNVGQQTLELIAS